MVANPMQRKARNSFLSGMAIMLVICVIIGILVYFLLSGQDKAKQEQEKQEQQKQQKELQILTGTNI